jgi:hypothetical protein
VVVDCLAIDGEGGVRRAERIYVGGGQGIDLISDLARCVFPVQVDGMGSFAPSESPAG